MNKKNNAEKVRNMRRLRFGTASTVLTIVVIAIVILLNVVVGVVADKYPISWDLSKDKVYTLSDISVEIAKKADKPMEIVVFDDEANYKNPNFGIPELDTIIREFYNALQQYNKYSDGNITFSFISPNQDPTAFAKYKKYDVQPMDILFRCGERHKKSTVPDLIHQEQSSNPYGGQPIIESKVEKILASSVNALQADSDRLVQVLVGHEEDGNALAGLKSLYELNGYTFEEVSITGSKDFNKDAQVMLIAAPAKDYSNEEIKRVQQWVYNEGNYGHHLVVFVNPIADCPNLFELLKVEYGVTVTDELIQETDGNRLVGYDSTLLKSDINKNKYTSNSDGTGTVFTPLTRRLITELPSTAEQGTLNKLGIPLTSYPKSAQLMKLESLKQDDQDKDKDKEENKPYKPADEEYPLTSMIVTEINSYNNNTGNSVDGRVLVCGSPAMVYSAIPMGFMGNMPVLQNPSFKNEELMLDTLNAMTGNKDSLAISNKKVTADTVQFTPKTAKIVGLGVFTLGLPALILVICLVVFIRRKNL